MVDPYAMVALRSMVGLGLLAVVAACGDDVAADAGGSSGTASTASDDSGAGGDGSTTGTGDPTAGTATGTATLTATTTGTGETSSTTAPCIPDDTRCTPTAHQMCSAQGIWEDVESCDPLQGMGCDPVEGCTGECVATNLGLSYVGCDYYPTVTSQFDLYNTSPEDDFAVAVANTASDPTQVTITQGATTIESRMVGANTVEVIELPWVDPLTKGTGPSVLVPTGAYRLRSDRPVTVYQYNPLVATSTNDASLLLPTSGWGLRYVVASYNHAPEGPGFYAVTAMEDGTEVALQPSATGGTVQAGDGVAADGTGVVTLDRGDVLEVYSESGGASPDPSDLTGTIVAADKPVQVIGGHQCTNVPWDIKACDHLEEAMFPVETLATVYYVAPSAQVPDDTQLKGQVVRIIATEDDTTLSYEPPPPSGPPTQLARAGDFVHLDGNTEMFRVTADKKISVVQYMVGNAAGMGDSDPSMVQAVSVDQFRSEYLFHAQVNWVSNYVDIIAPATAVVSVDGAPVMLWTPIGTTPFSVAHVPLDNSGFGDHRVDSDVPVGITVYGVRDSGSYWFPGGLDLNIVPG